MQQLASRYRRYRRPSGGDAMRALSRGGSRRLLPLPSGREGGGGGLGSGVTSADSPRRIMSDDIHFIAIEDILLWR